MEMISILLVDDHKLVLDTWSSFLQTIPGFSIAGTTGDTEQALQYVKQLRPAIVLADINMLPLDGFELTRRITAITNFSKVIGVSLYSQPAYAKKMMQSGARGYVSKSSEKEELVTAIREVYAGRKYICKKIKEQLAAEMASEKNCALTERQAMVIDAIKKGLSSKQIAGKMGVSVKTIEAHRYNILCKLDLPNTAALINYIHAHGL